FCGKIGCVGTSVSHRYPETLGGPYHYIRSELTGRGKQYETQDIGSHGYFNAIFFSPRNKFPVIVNLSVFSGILKNCTEKIRSKTKRPVVSGYEFHAKGSCPGFQDRKSLWQYF